MNAQSSAIEPFWAVDCASYVASLIWTQKGPAAVEVAKELFWAA